MVGTVSSTRGSSTGGSSSSGGGSSSGGSSVGGRWWILKSIKMIVPKDVIKEIKDIINQEESHTSGQKESYVFVINNRWDYNHNSINVIDKRIEDNLEYLKSRVQENKPIYFTCIHELIDDINCLESLKNSIKKYNLTTTKICQQFQKENV